ncbi:MAG: DUF433 domain-containing protein [Chloroflexi bacterium]|nr:DUF433 domain-containing protein [Chloroflexota bacterium]MCC6894573.1 DUF433 domain-containing protein [Anaerolineae bacterium]
MSTLTPAPIDLSKYIELRDDRAHIRGRKLPVAFVAIAHETNQTSIADLAYQFTLTEEQVLAALLYYREHKTQIDAQETADREQSQQMHERYGNK